ncbi:MAG: GNAT family N-acetyltransferase [Deltaproteobacteria bacterium]|nr:GNAT family N-acetyltransferase [Deltaproteobacteria bacterium]
MSLLTIQPVQTPKQLQEFIELPYRLYSNTASWVAPLYQERRDLLNPKKNPFFEHAKVQLFIAKKEEKVVGRISAQIDFEYEKFHKERVGHFGFFESENDPAIAQALLKAAEDWVKQEGAKKILGPFSFSINEETGLLVEGFDQPQMTMIPYNFDYYASLLQQAGYQKAKDLFCWYYPATEVPEAPTQIAAEVGKYPGLKIRHLDKKHFQKDLEIILDIFNSAWNKNWGFVPLTPKEVEKSAADLKLFIDPEMALIAEVDGKPAAMCLCVPNLYELIQGLKGRLFPLGIFKLLWRIKQRKYKSARLLLLGIKNEYRGSVLGGLSVLLYVEIHRRGLARGYQWGELSWTLEDNEKINTGIEFMGGKKYKTLRVYEKQLVSS